MDSVRIQGCNAILVFIRSFEGVTSENCPSLESLRDGFIFATIYNQMTNPPNMFDTSLLRHPADENDWPTCLMNLTRLYCHIEPQLELLNFNYYIDLCKIAKDEDIDQISKFIKMLVKYLFKGPKNAELGPKFHSLPIVTQITAYAGL